MANSLQNGPDNGRAEHGSAFTRLINRITESRYFMVSIIVHAILVIVAGSIVMLNTSQPQEEWTTGAAVPGLDTTPAPPAKPDEQPKVPDEMKVRQPEAGGAMFDVVRAFAPDAPNNLTTQMCFVAIPNPKLLISAPMAIPRIDGIPSGVDSAFALRFGSKGNAVAMQRGATDKSRRAVERSLQWLRDNQNADGSWGDSNRNAMTGLALLCFLGFGELPDSPQYGFTINSAVQWLLDNGTKSEGRLSMEKTFTQSGVYEHGIATYALGEFFALTHDDRVKDLLAQAVAHIVQGQGPGGGWSYGFDKTADDLSVSGWQIQALKAAHLTKLALPGVDAALDKAMRHIERVQGPKGGYGYRSAEDRYSLTGVGIVSRLFWKGEVSEVRKGMMWLLAETEKNHPVKYRGESADLYAWYYHTQACLMFGGASWEKWNRWFQDELCAVQSSDGSWPIPGAQGHGPQSADTKSGAVYRTTLCTLMLEVFYRYTAVHR